jgi:hypothetical protein
MADCAGAHVSHMSTCKAGRRCSASTARFANFLILLSLFPSSSSFTPNRSANHTWWTHPYEDEDITLISRHIHKPRADQPLAFGSHPHALCGSTVFDAMRLLNTRTLRLETFHADSSKLKYAILSHTWGDEEITYEDLRAEPAQMKLKTAAYVKIHGACEQAKRDLCDYIWIDTCCIDKSSSTELSEAINSMFKWYEDAWICYVYLVDCSLAEAMITAEARDLERAILEVSFYLPPLRNEHDMTVATTTGHLLSQSRWFTRGWTLQELIAPTSIVFFDQRWSSLGSRQSLARDISAITQIPDALLSRSGPFSQDSISASLSTISVAARMSWASRRQTSRVEDMSYSLLGLFGVHVPLLYGEGGEASFERLQREIIRKIDDQSILAWRSDSGMLQDGSGRSVEVGNPLAPSPFYFAGCADIVSEASATLTESSINLVDRGVEASLFLRPSGRLFRTDVESQGLRESNGGVGSWVALLDCVYLNSNYLDRPAILLQNFDERPGVNASTWTQKTSWRLRRASTSCIKMSFEAGSAFGSDSITAKNPPLNGTLQHNWHFNNIRQGESCSIGSPIAGFMNIWSLKMTLTLDTANLNGSTLRLERVRLETAPSRTIGREVKAAFPPFFYNSSIWRLQNSSTQVAPLSEKSPDENSSTQVISLSANPAAMTYVREHPGSSVIPYKIFNEWNPELSSESFTECASMMKDLYGKEIMPIGPNYSSVVQLTSRNMRFTTLGVLWLEERRSSGTSDGLDLISVTWGLKTPGYPLLEDQVYGATSHSWWVGLSPWCAIVESNSREAIERDAQLAAFHQTKKTPNGYPCRINETRITSKPFGSTRTEPDWQFSAAEARNIGQKAGPSKRKSGWEISCEIKDITWAARKAIVLQIDFRPTNTDASYTTGTKEILAPTRAQSTIPENRSIKEESDTSLELAKASLEEKMPESENESMTIFREVTRLEKIGHGISDLEADKATEQEGQPIHRDNELHIQSVSLPTSYDDEDTESTLTPVGTEQGSEEGSEYVLDNMLDM